MEDMKTTDMNSHHKKDDILPLTGRFGFFVLYEEYIRG